jgi:NIMA (never in mitosis gene a)-related kinase
VSDRKRREAMKEVQILKKLDHPNIIKYYGSFVEDQSLFIVMEYAEGGDLHRVLKEQKDLGKRFSEKELWTFAYEISLAVSALHSRWIIHRDIKCMNILLTGDRHVKIGDLGASKMSTAAAQMHVTRVGTPLYLAPELVKQHPYDFKADIWAMGWVMYHLASFESPFNGDNLVALGNAIVNKKPKPLPPCYSGRFTSMVTRLLEKKANERPNIFQVL